MSSSAVVPLWAREEDVCTAAGFCRRVCRASSEAADVLDWRERETAAVVRWNGAGT